MKRIAHIKDSFQEHQVVLQKTENLFSQISKAVQIITRAYKNNKQTLWCGNGGSFSDCLHAVGELVSRFKLERRALPAITLGAELATSTAIANDYDFKNIFSRGVEAFGKKGDVLIGISTSGNSENIIQAVKQAKKQKIKTIGLLGKHGGKLKNLVDLSIIIPSDNTPRIQEMHILIIHIICELIEKTLFQNSQR